MSKISKLVVIILGSIFAFLGMYFGIKTPDVLLMLSLVTASLALIVFLIIYIVSFFVYYKKHKE